MTTQSLLLLLITLLITISVLSHDIDGFFGSRKASPVRGGWVAITDIYDPEIQDIANFAITKHNVQSRDSLVFLKVISGKVTPVDGTLYRLKISARAWYFRHYSYEATVWVKPWEDYRELTSFKFLG